MTRSIPATLRYDLLAQTHRPADADGLRAAARELERQGLKAADIANALRISSAAALALLQPEEAQP